MKTLAAIALLAVLCSACTTTTIQKDGEKTTMTIDGTKTVTAGGFRAKRRTILSKHTVADLNVSLTTNGTQFGLSGYQSDEAAALAMAVEAAVRAGIAGAKP